VAHVLAKLRRQLCRAKVAAPSFCASHQLVREWRQRRCDVWAECIAGIEHGSNVVTGHCSCCRRLWLVQVG
jgi:hypothetical protein